MSIEEVIKAWRELSPKDKYETVLQLQNLTEASEIEEELNSEAEILTDGFQKEPGNEEIATKHHYFCGDFLESQVCDLIKERNLRPHLIVTSPPYNAGIDYGVDFDDKKPTKKYIRFLRDFLDKSDVLLRNGGRIAVNIRDIAIGKGKRLPILVPIYNHLCEEMGYTYRGMHIWYKGREESSFAWGSWLESVCPSIIDLFEYVFIFQKGEYLDGEDNMEKTEFIENVLGIWKIRPVKKVIGKKRENIAKHPCPYPVELARRVIKLYSHVGDIVLDPFAGIFSTNCAAAMSGRNSIGVEINRDYCQVGIDRFNKIFASSLFQKIFLKELQ